MALFLSSTRFRALLRFSTSISRFSAPPSLPPLRAPPSHPRGPSAAIPRATWLCSGASFSSRPSDAAQGPTVIDYSSLLSEEEYHRLADGTIHDLQEKIEEYGDEVQIDGFDVDYGNQVLTVKLGSSGTYVINKQTPNRQIWLSSPLSGPSRFDWDSTVQSWVYRRTKSKLLGLLEDELEQLCGKPINLH